MELWIVLAAVVGGVCGYIAGYRVARDRGCLMISVLAEFWGKSDKEVRQAFGEIFGGES
jgi:hypothetical protein